jgi:hypothetical protein
VIALVLGAASLLGQGERCRIDPLLAQPGSALAAYWEALQLNDVARVWSCSVERDNELPFPGMMWFLPPSRALWLEHISLVRTDKDHTVASYEVHFRPIGAPTERRLRVVTELVHVRGEWLVEHPLSEAGLLNGRPLMLRSDS